MQKLFIVLILLFTTLATKPQEVTVPDEARSFIAKGFEPLDYVTGDLNGDKKTDAILLLKQPGEDTFDIDAASIRPIILLIRQTDGKLKQVARNDKAIMCRQCGGVFGDPYSGTEIITNGFTLSFYGGSSWRWGTDYRFMYKPAKKNWYLVREAQTSFQSGDPERTTTNVTIEETELGEVPFEKVDNSYLSQEIQWKVKAVKTYFYDNPKLGSKPRKGFLLKGNSATGIRELTNFIELSFVDSKNNITTGFILRKDLEKVK
ncbi:MAG: hypothetical protein ABI688_06135 [Bacteroidota bacterium]